MQSLIFFFLNLKRQTSTCELIDPNNCDLCEELEEKQPVISYFCTNEDERRNNASAVLRSLLWQITRLHPDLAQHFRQQPLLAHQQRRTAAEGAVRRRVLHRACPLASRKDLSIVAALIASKPVRTSGASCT